MKADIEKLFLDSLINSLPDNIYFKDTESRFLMVNRALAKRFNLTDPAQALGRTDFDFFEEEHSRLAREDELVVMRTGNPIVGKEEHETTLEGSSQWVLTTKLPLYDTDGQLIGTFGVSRDVTDIKLAQQALLESEAELRRHQDKLEEEVRKRTEELSIAHDRMKKEVQDRRVAEQSLRISEERYRRLLQVNPTYIYNVTIKKKQPVQTEHGPGCALVTGYSPEEYITNPNLWIVMVHPEDRDLVRKFITEDLTQRNHQNQIEHRIFHKDGRLRWVRNTVVHHYDDQGELARYDGLVEDITARKYADQRQRENERLRAISIMAEGVVSNYTRAVENITAHASAIMGQVPADSLLHNEASAILNDAESTAALNHRLSAIARAYSQEEARLTQIDIRSVVNAALEPLSRTFSGQNLEIKTFIPADIPSVCANADQLLDSLTIMLSNAAEAMPGGGTITITASSKNILRSSHRWNQTARGGKYVILRITDTGIGMDRDTARKVFDSFFSTKKSGAFGLGLAMAQAAAKSWGGWVRVRSSPGQGSVFRLFIPTSVQTGAVIVTPKPAVTLRGRTVLIVDDKMEMAELISHALASEGMNVLVARTDLEAVDLFADNIDRISLSIIDMVLGEAEWHRTISQIYKLKPESHVIIMSGFSRDFARLHLPVGAWSFIQKPFEPSDLVDMANDIISRDVS